MFPERIPALFSSECSIGETSQGGSQDQNQEAEDENRNTEGSRNNNRQRPSLRSNGQEHSAGSDCSQAQQGDSPSNPLPANPVPFGISESGRLGLLMKRPGELAPVSLELPLSLSQPDFP